MSALTGTMTNRRGASKRLAIGNLHVPSAPERDLQDPDLRDPGDSDGEN